MKVYKFGGASVKDAGGIRNLDAIISIESGNLVVVVSAFGKTTNNLENVLKAWITGDESYLATLEKVYKEHLLVANELFYSGSEIFGRFETSFLQLKEYLISASKESYDHEYDQIVSYGEIWSTMIVEAYIKQSGRNSCWLDIRESVITDNNFRYASILWDESTSQILKNFDFRQHQIYVTQGFIGGTIAGETTTLGREGSDYTAAVLANILDAECVILWKDVPGIMNADPKWFTGAEILEEISYKEAVEMTFSGAKVIHPKTIKPLHNKNIPLYVRPFLDISKKGTIVKADAELKKVLPVYIRKEDQILISILPKDLSFVIGYNLAKIFHSFQANGIKVNLVEASAVSLDVCADDERTRIESFINENESEFSVVYNEDVELLSVRHYTPASVTKVTDGRQILLEQRTRSTVRFVVRKAQRLNGA